MQLSGKESKDTEEPLLVRVLKELETSETADVDSLHRNPNNGFIFGPRVDRFIVLICMFFFIYSMLGASSTFGKNIALWIIQASSALFFGWLGLIFVSENCRAFGFHLIQFILFTAILVGVIYLLTIIPVSAAIILGSLILGLFIYLSSRDQSGDSNGN